MNHEHSFRRFDVDAEIASNRQHRRERLIDFAKGELLDAYDKNLPQAHIDSQRLRLANLLGIVGTDEPGEERLAA